MKIAACGTLLSSETCRAVITIPETTSLGKIAGAVVGMAHAYSVDGTTFYTAGDLVNALASYWYGFGWLHFGSAFGLFSTPCSGMNSCPFVGRCESLPVNLTPKLIEKTTRYARLLDTARASVVPAPDPATSAHDFASRLLVIVACYATQGTYYQQEGLHEDALACFSYGHGWLDAGVRSGLFRITRNRDLFTV
jgi:hypothetical protein